MASNLHTEFQPEKQGQPFASPSISNLARRRAPSFVVRDGDLPRTVARYRNGVSGPELKRLSEAAHFIERRGSAVFVTIELATEDDDETEIRELGEKIKNHVVLFQSRKGCPPYWIEVLEPTPSLHAHLIVAAPKGHVGRLIESLEGSSIFGEAIDAKRVHDMPGLTRYLSKLATPQAAYGRDIRRVRGSHRMEGDRVRLSRALERDMIAEGVAEPFRRTYARRFSPPQIVYRDSLFDALPILAAPPRPKLKPVKRHKIEPASLPMNYAPDAIDKVNDMRGRMTCAEIGNLIGLSRQQVNNADVLRFGMSRRVVRRVLELARAA